MFCLFVVKNLCVLSVMKVKPVGFYLAIFDGNGMSISIQLERLDMS